MALKTQNKQPTYTTDYDQVIQSSYKEGLTAVKKPLKTLHTELALTKPLETPKTLLKANLVDQAPLKKPNVEPNSKRDITKEKYYLCSVCRKLLSIDSFYKDRSRLRGHMTACKPCRAWQSNRARQNRKLGLGPRANPPGNPSVLCHNLKAIKLFFKAWNRIQARWLKEGKDPENTPHMETDTRIVDALGCLFGGLIFTVDAWGKEIVIMQTPDGERRERLAYSTPHSLASILAGYRVRVLYKSGSDEVLNK